MAYWILKVVLTPVLRCLYRFDVQGTDNIPRRGPVIVASNHQSFIDSIFIPLVVHRRVTFVAKAEYFDNPRTAWFFRAVGQIPVERALASAREVLDSGGVLGIYPEGTRSPDGRIYRGHTGVARLALASGAMVVPVALVGTAAVQPVGAMRPRIFRRVAVRIGPPLTWSLRRDEVDHPAALRKVTDEVMAAIARLSEQERADGYAERRGPLSGGQERRALRHRRPRTRAADHPGAGRTVDISDALGVAPGRPEGSPSGPAGVEARTSRP
jgi:1-acyl-sn-glycerol-3-phosphate acyltransferase